MEDPCLRNAYCFIFIIWLFRLQEHVENMIKIGIPEQVICRTSTTFTSCNYR